MSDIVDRIRAWEASGNANLYGLNLLLETTACISILRERLATAQADIETAYARGYADATKSIVAVHVRDHG